MPDTFPPDSATPTWRSDRLEAIAQRDPVRTAAARREALTRALAAIDRAERCARRE